MKHRYFTLWLAILLLGGLVFITGCNDSTTGDSAAAAAAQLGLGGDDLAASSNALDVQAEGAQLGHWTSDFPAAQKLAQEQDLPILLFFNGSDWSISSNTFIQNVLQNQEWLDYLPNYPKEWICGYDPDQVLRSDTLYWLRAIPSLYLLDGEKRVILKDATLQQVLVALMD